MDFRIIRNETEKEKEGGEREGGREEREGGRKMNYDVLLEVFGSYLASLVKSHAK